MMKQRKYESPSVTTDTVIFTIEEDKLKVLLIKRGLPPFAGNLALPGVFLLKDETIRKAAHRALAEKTGVKVSYIEQLYTFDSPHRDPRGHVVSIAYFALVPEIKAKRSSLLQSPDLYPINKLPQLAFDHKTIVKYALERLRAKLEYTNVIFSLLPKEFTLTQLQRTYEIILGKKLDKRNFRKKFNSLGLIRPVDKKIKGVSRPARHSISGGRPAKLYEFKNNKLTELKKFF